MTYPGSVTGTMMTCQRCGIRYVGAHDCRLAAGSTASAETLADLSTLHLSRIATAIERIAAALEQPDMT